MALTSPPTAPTIADPTTFAARADALVAWHSTNVTELGALQTDVAAKQVLATNAVTDATTQVGLATAQVALATTQAGNASTSASLAQAAASSAGSIAWVSGTTYAIGDLRYSPTDFQTYRRKTAGAGTTDPSADTTNWIVMDGLPSKTGNSGKVLTTNGTVSSWGAIPDAGLILLATLTPTASANVDFLSTFSSTYDTYLILGDSIAPATTDQLMMRLASGGSAISTSTYANQLVDYTSGGLSAAMTIAFSVFATGKGSCFQILLRNANDATNAKTGNVSVASQTTAVPNWQGQTFDFASTYAGSISGMRFYWNTASNFAVQGRIRVYGIKNA